MSDPAEFVSFVRRSGAPEGERHGRATDTVTAVVEGDHGAVDVRLQYATPGPRDVRGLRPGAVRRQVPAPGTWAAEEEDRPYVEFTEADLPWRYSHRTVTVDGRRVVVPWCVLVVGTPDQVIVAGAEARLRSGVQAEHPLGQAHRWAHVQRQPGATGAGVARVLCARTPPAIGTTFADETEHTAALVVPWGPDGGPLWPSSGGEDVTVRCLISWRYRTGKAGGFRELAAQLQPADADPIGTVTVVRDPGGAVMQVPGALTATVLGPPTTDELDTAVLADDTDGPPLERVVVGPPAYGAPWLPGGHDRIRADVTAATDENPGDWSWHVEANADLRRRIVAGLGVQAGVELQEEVVTSAARRWGAGDAAAEAVAGCVLGAAATARLWKQRAPADAAARLRLLGPAAAALTTTVELPDGTPVVGPTVRDLVSAPEDAAALPFPAAAMSPVLGRALPAGGPVARHSAEGATGTAALVDAVRTPDAPPHTPWDEHEQGTVAPEDLDAGHVDGVLLATAHAEPTDPSPEALRDGLLGHVGEGIPVHPEEPRPQLPVRVDVLVGCLESALDPVGGGPVRTRVSSRIDGLDPDRPFAPLEDCPDLDLPAWRWLRDRAPHWLLPGAENLAPGEVVALRTNPAFVEAFLLGLNSQVLAELRWRGHPVSDGCTPLRRFWERRPGPTGRRLDDIRGVQEWVDATGTPVGRLGTHAATGVMGEQLVVVVRSELFRRYPRTLLYLADDDGHGRARLEPGSQTPPESVTAVAPDLTMFAFRLEPDDVGTRWIVVEEQPDGIRFWLEDRTPTAPPGTPDDGAGRAARQVRQPLRVILPGAATLGVGP
jgi:hypothetical protein